MSRLNRTATRRDLTDPAGFIPDRSTKTTFYDDFTTKPNGALAAGALSDSGHTYYTIGQLPWAISGGRLCHVKTNWSIAESSYLGVNLGIEAGDKVGYIWVDYELPAGTDPQESLTLVASQDNFTSPLVAGQYEYNNAAGHCTFNSADARYDSLQALHPGLTTTVLGRDQFPALVSGTTYRAEILIVGRRAWIVSPAGVPKEVNAADFIADRSGPWATLQLYTNNDGLSKRMLKVLRWGAELQRRVVRGPYASRTELAKVASRPGRLLGQMETSANSVQTAITTATSAKLMGLSVPIPPSRRLFVEGLAWFQTTVPPMRAVAQLALGVYVAGTSSYGKLSTISSGFTPQNNLNAYTVSVAGSAGTFTVTVGGQTTAAMPYNETAANVQAAIQALSSVGSGKAIVTLAGTTYSVLLDPSLTNRVLTAVGTGGATVGYSATYVEGRLFPFAQIMDLDPAFFVGDVFDMQVKATATANSVYTFIDSGGGTGFSGIMRSTMKISEAA